MDFFSYLESYMPDSYIFRDEDKSNDTYFKKNQAIKENHSDETKKDVMSAVLNSISNKNSIRTILRSR